MPDPKQAKRVGPETIEHWLSLVPDARFSSRDFYDRVQAEVDAQQVPSLEASRVDLSEGGALAEGREYLRFRRERLYFDVCAAPVGKNYFFSFRYYVLPAEVDWWEIGLVFAALYLLLEQSTIHIGYFLGPTLLAAACALAAWTARNAIMLGMRDLDATLLKLPVLGPLYERFLRRDTYYRQDVRMVYGSLVSSIVKAEAERVTAAKGAVLIREFTYSPVFEELYRARERAVPEQARGTAAPPDP